jgi:lipoprotein-anchoring transpeptidase ErfK/SrfK
MTQSPASNQPRLEIIGTPHSSNVRLVRMACEEKGVPYDLAADIHHSTPIPDSIHPFGAIPVMRHGAIELGESKAIATYIDRTFGGPRLIPADPVLEAKVEQWVSIVNSILYPVMVRDFVARYDFAREFKSEHRSIKAAFERMKAQFRVLERATASGHLVQGHYTLADMALMALLDYVRHQPHVERLLRTAKNVTAYFERHAARPAFTITAPPPFPARLQRQEVAYASTEAPGTIVIDPQNTYLYYLLPEGRAIRYGIGIGREGFEWAGVETVTRKAVWPDWTPPARMIQRQPYLPQWAPGGPETAIGARALYLGEGLYRIHGTNAPSSIGTRSSAGCFRMRTDDVIDLYGRVDIGTKVVVLPKDQPRRETGVATEGRQNPVAAL